MTIELSYFPENYSDSRRRFSQRLARLPASAQRGSWIVPGKTDDDLAVDYVFLPPTERKDRLFVMVSGVHGLEAYAGAAVQSMFLDEILPGLDRTGSGFLLVHSMNPFGFKHGRRGTEANVNLNRNFSAGPELYQIRNDESLRLSDLLIPRRPVSSVKSALVELFRQGKPASADGLTLDAFIKGVGPGQFATPEGLEFGGRGPEPQTAAFVDHLRPLMKDYRDVILFDLHTGLGDRERLHLIPGDDAGCVDQTLFHQLYDPAADQAIYHYTTSDTDGFYRTYGDLNSLFPQLAKPDQRVCALTMEFGTIGHSLEDQLESLNRWLLEHQGFLYGYADPAIEAEIKALNADKFCPRSESWRNNAVKVSRELFHRVFARAGLRGPSNR